MDGTDRRFAYRCLPLLIANQAGWFILNEHEFQATWNGGNEPADISIDYHVGPKPYAVTSHFGYGILTWTLPYLFRTPRGYNLLVRGPANYPKAGVCSLEGIVEADWSAATFTMNWKITQPGLPVAFAIGEPICMLVPQRRGELEEYRPEICALDRKSELGRGYEQWSRGREKFLDDLQQSGSTAQQLEWQKDYFRGSLPAGGIAAGHQLKLNLREFVVVTSEEPGCRDSSNQ
jgi:hypothetical protein